MQIEDDTLERLRDEKAKLNVSSYSKVINNALDVKKDIKEKLKKGQKITSEDLNVVDVKRFKG